VERVIGVGVLAGLVDARLAVANRVQRVGDGRDRLAAALDPADAGLAVGVVGALAPTWPAPAAHDRGAATAAPP
jgi:hypothetical protein